MIIKILALFFVLNFFLVLINNKFASFIKIVDLPDGKRKFQKKPVPLTGGTYLILNLNLAFIILQILMPSLGVDEYISTKREYLALILGLNSFYLLGLYDDKYKLKANSKLLITSILITIFILIDNKLIIKDVNFSFYANNIELKSFSFFFTVLCFLLLTNALNMFDGINLQASSYCILIFSVFLTKSVFIEISSIMIIALFFFLYLNFKNRSYLGESGILTLSYFIGYVFIKLNTSSNPIFFADEIFILLAVPGLDMFRLFFLRLTSGKHPFYGDTNHIHHLVCKKFSNFKTYLIIFSYIFLTIIFYYYISAKFIYLLLTIFFYTLFIFYFKKNKKL